MACTVPLIPPAEIVMLAGTERAVLLLLVRLTRTAPGADPLNVAVISTVPALATLPGEAAIALRTTFCTTLTDVVALARL
jgi:hypothetical protein